jgi:hypothetical protein
MFKQHTLLNIMLSQQTTEKVITYLILTLGNLAGSYVLAHLNKPPPEVDRPKDVYLVSSEVHCINREQYQKHLVKEIHGKDKRYEQ